MSKLCRMIRCMLALFLTIPRLFAGEYNPVADAVNIAPTPLTMPSAVKVYGEPRMTQGHPCTLWDQQDIDALKELLKTNAELRGKFDALKAEMDRRISEPLGVPEAGGPPPTREILRKHRANADVISNLGTVYVLTGDEKYGEYAKQMLVAYARVYPRLPHSADWTERKYRSAQDGRLTGQFLEDGFLLVNLARGADLIYNLKSWTEEERTLVRDDLFEAIASEFYHPVLTGNTYINATHNRSAMCTSGVLMAGYATDNEKLVNIALYGNDGTPEKPTGGILGTHFTAKCIFPDGLWNEGAPGYQLGIASSALMNDAEVLWHHGIDLYRHDNGLLKRLLDSPIGLAYPTPKMDVPLLHDSQPLALLDSRNWFSNEAGMPYMYGYVRYRDPAYIPIVRNASKDIRTTVHAGPTSLFLDLPSDDQVPPRRIESANYYSVGYGVLRVPAAVNNNQLLMEFGPSGSHGHPSKLAIDLFALDEPLMPLCGVLFPYNNPLDAKWYWTTLANCALTVDERSQAMAGNLYKYPRGTPNPEAKQLVFGPASTIGIQRAWADNLYPPEKIVQDRSLFLTANYMADLFAAAGTAPRKYDLAWHFRGKLTTSLNLTPFTFPEPVPDGYNALTNVRKAQSGAEPWSLSVQTAKGKTAWFFSAGADGMDVFVGDGYFVSNDEQGKRVDEQPPTVIQRMGDQRSVLFGNATDLSGGAAPYIKKVVQKGGMEDGYGLLKIETVQGTDICFTSYKEGSFAGEGIQTDARQAMVVNKSSGVSALYLGGGTFLKTGAVQITRSEAGLACLEKLANGKWLLSNPSPAAASITVALDGVDKLQAYEMDRGGNRLSAVKIMRSAGSVTVSLNSSSQVELSAE